MPLLRQIVLAELARGTHSEAFADGARYAVQEAEKLDPPALVASEAFVVPLEDPNDPSADEWARLDAANAEAWTIDALVTSFVDMVRAGHVMSNRATLLKATRDLVIRARQVPS